MLGALTTETALSRILFLSKLVEYWPEGRMPFSDPWEGKDIPQNQEQKKRVLDLLVGIYVLFDTQTLADIST